MLLVCQSLGTASCKGSKILWCFNQVASQFIHWLHEEALKVQIKASCDFLCLSFELGQGEVLSLVARVVPEDAEGCVPWWLATEDGFARGEETSYEHYRWSI
ncbi:mediator of RNA polymerase II transcription subunit 17-like isoform X2 [Hevea brasiliensis]|uniref:mediator of RNA polymerase II transcription subunit 17-like isoform X2 n=1 Tax=Hevea brasiliensis TaxID=3981 RepID=UPI0025CC0024|nr:mediator of RNA polymerase II transcription subunit 17-like isoform X2 [Hevea brasiliensis]